MLHCKIGEAALSGLHNQSGFESMSKQLKLSATLSLVLMAGFAVFAQLAAVAPQALIGG